MGDGVLFGVCSFCEYPQSLAVELFEPAFVERVDVVFDALLVPSELSVFVDSSDVALAPSHEGGSFDLLGTVKLSAPVAAGAQQRLMKQLRRIVVNRGVSSIMLRLARCFQTLDNT